jgi:phage terminase large subunit-like protein
MHCQAMLEINSPSMCMHVNGYIRMNEIQEIVVLSYTPLESLESVYVGRLRVMMMAE